MRDQRVMDSLRGKFANKGNVQGYIMSQQDRLDYSEAQAKGDTKTMMAIKSGQRYNAEISKRIEEEMKSFDIKEVLRELDTIVNKYDDLKIKKNKLISTKVENLKEEYDVEVEKLFKRGQASGSRQYLMLLEEYNKKIENVSKETDVLEIQRKLIEMERRQRHLELMREKYKEDNKDLIEELRKEQIKTNLRELNLID